MKQAPNILVLFLLIMSLTVFACNLSQPDVQSGDSQPEVSEPGSDSPPAGSSSNGLDACALLTKADAEALLGQPVGDPEHPVEGSATFNVTSCKYRVAGESTFENVYLIVTVPSNGSLESAKIAFETDKTSSKEMLGADPVDVPGLGDSAFWVAGMGNTLAILRDNVHLILSATNQEGESVPQPILDLANVILSRLP